MSKLTPESIFLAASIDPAALTHIPGKAVHDRMVSADAWLDADEGLLMFVGQRDANVAQFMYYIGEEGNRAARGVGKGIVAFEIDEDRVRWLRARLPAVPS